MDLRGVQNELLSMLKMLDEICQKEGIRYFLDSGAAIGAVREKGFIPWDDDVDVAILRPDYERLRKVIRTQLPSNIKFVEPEDFSPYFFDFIPRIVNLDIPLREETDEDVQYHNYQNRASIDFIILDNAPSSKLAQRLMRLRCKMTYGLAMSKRYMIHSERYSATERIMSGVCVFMGHFMSREKIMDQYQKNCMRYAKKETPFLIRSNSLLNYIGFYPKSFYMEEIYLKFEDAMFPLPKEYDAILRQLYGDYMTPVRDGFIQHYISKTQEENV